MTAPYIITIGAQLLFVDGENTAYRLRSHVTRTLEVACDKFEAMEKARAKYVEAAKQIFHPEIRIHEITMMVSSLDVFTEGAEKGRDGLLYVTPGAHWSEGPMRPQYVPLVGFPVSF